MEHTDVIKEHISFLLIGGSSIPDDNLLFMCLSLTELLGISSEQDIEKMTEYSFTSMFSIKIMNFLKEENYDGFINAIKVELLEQENYELLQELSL